MKRKLAILENDIKYLSKLVEEFHEKYPDRFEVYKFTDHENAFTTLNRVKNNKWAKQSKCCDAKLWGFKW